MYTHDNKNLLRRTTVFKERGSRVDSSKSDVSLKPEDHDKVWMLCHFSIDPA